MPTDSITELSTRSARCCAPAQSIRQCTRRAQFALERLPLLVVLFGGSALAAMPFYGWEILHDERMALDPSGLLALAYMWLRLAPWRLRRCTHRAGESAQLSAPDAVEAVYPGGSA